MKSNKSNRFSPEVRERAVRMVQAPCVRIVVASNFPTRQKLEDLIHDESTLL